MLLGWAAPLHANMTLTQYKTKARTLFYEGRKLAEQKAYLGAVEKYKQAIDVLKQAESVTKSKTELSGLRKSHATFQYIIGRTYHLNKSYEDAHTFYRRALSGGASLKVRQKILEYINDLKPYLKGTLRIVTTPAGVTLTLLGKGGQGKVGRSPTSWKIRPGTYTLTLAAPGYQTLQQSVTIKPGTSSKQTFILKKYGFIGPPQRIVKKRPTKKKKPTQQIRTEDALKWTGVGVAAIAGITGITFIAKAQSNFSQAQGMIGKYEFRNQTNTINNLVEGGNTFQYAGLVVVSIAVLAGAGATYLFLQPKTPAPQAQTHLVSPPSPSPSRTVQLHVSQ
tara:strand:+ start:8027 stop:9034 length:1008 start_codon:yes stop_codon:yes gene_type:complete